MFRKLKFEEEIYSELKLIPLSTQYKLDTIGVKLRQESWNALSIEARVLFCHLSIQTKQDREVYRRYLLYLLKRKRRLVQVLEPDEVESVKASWEDLSRIPVDVYKMVVEEGFILSSKDWISTDDFKRYVLFKLSQLKPRREYLKKALREILDPVLKISSKDEDGN